MLPAIALATLACGQATEPARIELRGGQVVEAPIAGVSWAGLELGGDAPRTLGWHVVKIVDGAGAAEAARFAELAADAWRAQQRLARGDVVLARPLYEGLFADQLADGSPADPVGPTPLLIAEGALQCRILDDDPGAAIVPWLVAVALRDAGADIAGETRPVVDPETGLVPELPPIWLAGTDVDVGVEPGVLPAESRARLLHELYAASVAWEAGRTPELPALPVDAGPGAVLVHAIVASRIGAVEARSDARARLEAVVDVEAGGWQEAWARLALGRALLDERQDDEVLRTTGIFHLLHVPARFTSTLPRLSAIALAEAAAELRAHGAAAEAAILVDRVAALRGGATAIALLEAGSPRRAALPDDFSPIPPEPRP